MATGLQDDASAATATATAAITSTTTTAATLPRTALDSFFQGTPRKKKRSRGGAEASAAEEEDDGCLDDGLDDEDDGDGKKKKKKTMGRPRRNADTAPMNSRMKALFSLISHVDADGQEIEHTDEPFEEPLSVPLPPKSKRKRKNADAVGGGDVGEKAAPKPFFRPISAMIKAPSITEFTPAGSKQQARMPGTNTMATPVNALRFAGEKYYEAMNPLFEAWENHIVPKTSGPRYFGVSRSDDPSQGRVFKVVRYKRVYYRRTTINATRMDRSTPGMRYCRYCEKELPLDKFYQNVKRYVCREHHIARTMSTMRRRKEADTIQSVAYDMWYKLHSMREYLGYDDLQMTVEDIRQLLIHCGLPLGMRLRVLPIDPSRPLRPRNFAFVSGETFQLILKTYKHMCSRALYISQVQRCNLIPPSFDTARPALPTHNPLYRRQEIDVHALFEQERTNERTMDSVDRTVIDVLLRTEPQNPWITEGTPQYAIDVAMRDRWAHRSVAPSLTRAIPAIVISDDKPKDDNDGDGDGDGGGGGGGDGAGGGGAAAEEEEENAVTVHHRLADCPLDGERPPLREKLCLKRMEMHERIQSGEPVSPASGSASASPSASGRDKERERSSECRDKDAPSAPLAVGNDKEGDGVRNGGSEGRTSASSAAGRDKKGGGESRRRNNDEGLPDELLQDEKKYQERKKRLQKERRLHDQVRHEAHQLARLYGTRPERRYPMLEAEQQQLKAQEAPAQAQEQEQTIDAAEADTRRALGTRTEAVQDSIGASVTEADDQDRPREQEWLQTSVAMLSYCEAFEAQQRAFKAPEPSNFFDAYRRAHEEQQQQQRPPSGQEGTGGAAQAAQPQTTQSHPPWPQPSHGQAQAVQQQQQQPWPPLPQPGAVAQAVQQPQPPWPQPMHGGGAGTADQAAAIQQQHSLARFLWMMDQQRRRDEQLTLINMARVKQNILMHEHKLLLDEARAKAEAKLEQERQWAFHQAQLRMREQQWMGEMQHALEHQQMHQQYVHKYEPLRGTRAYRKEYMRQQCQRRLDDERKLFASAMVAAPK